MRFLAVCTCLGALAVAPVARAEPSGPDALDEMYAQANPQPPKVVEPLHIDQVWYGWQTLLADVPLVTALATVPAWAHFEGDGWLIAANVVALFVTTPMLHRLNGNQRSSGFSLLARIAAPGLFGIAGYAIGIAWFPPIAENAAFVGVAAGFGFAAFVDALGLAWKPHQETKTASAPWSIAPVAFPRGAGLGMGRVF